MSGLKDNLTLTAQDVRTEAIARLQEALKLEADGYRVTPEMIYDVLLHAAATGQSVEASSTELLDTASGNRLREVINAQLTERYLDGLELALNQSLVVDLPRRVRRAKLEVAIDEHDQPFYGKDPDLLALTCRSRAKAGTKQFFRIATAYVMHEGVRFTLALAFVLPGHTRPIIVDVLVDRIRRLGLHLQRLWLDRGFEGVELYVRLDGRRVPTVAACPIRGQSGGTRALCTGRGSYTTQHRFRSAKHRTTYTRIDVARAFRLNDQGRREAFWMVFVQINSHLSPHQIREHYRRRFGIESSFRAMRQVRIRTNTSNGALRFIFLAIGQILVNIWTQLKFLYCQIPRRGRGGRPIAHARLRLCRVASFLRHAIEDVHGVVTSIDATVEPIGA